MSTNVAGIEVEAVEYDEGSTVVRTQFDQEKTTPSMAVIATLAEAKGVDPVDLEPLHTTIDTDALDTLGRFRDGAESDTHISFTHENRTITVQSYGVVTITPERDSTAKTPHKETQR